MRHNTLQSFVVMLALTFGSPAAFSKVEIKDNQPIEEVKTEEPSKAPAMKFFQRKPASEGNRAHFLGLHIGGFVDTESFKWGALDKTEDTGKLTIGVTYRMGEWSDTMDLLIRVDFNSYELPEGKPTKMSFMPMLVFPEASSKFPLYF